MRVANNLEIVAIAPALAGFCPRGTLVSDTLIRSSGRGKDCVAKFRPPEPAEMSIAFTVLSWEVRTD